MAQGHEEYEPPCAMSEHLLLVAIGPVQDFLAQARRTRDLWFGSHLLSELARVAVRTLLSSGAMLAFPALDRGDPELEECPGPLREGGKPPLAIPNKILAVVPPGLEPADLARSAREAVQRLLREIAGNVKKRCSGLIAPGTERVWDEQIETFLEFAAAWTRLGDYAEALGEVQATLAGRKSLRDFGPWQALRGAVPKSSLDGARETVIRPPSERDPGLVRGYRIAAAEQLDAIGLVKRAGGNPEQFVPLVNVALATWVAAANSLRPEEMGLLKDACAKLGVARVQRPDLPCACGFPFDAAVFLKSRWNSLAEELEQPAVITELGPRHVAPLLRLLGEPYPYVACVCADGDRMGRALGSLGSFEKHRLFSQALGRFPGEARRLVEQQHRGVLVYAGGDDALGFVPLSEALACADSLRRAFTSLLNTAVLPKTARTTLSVGIGVGHVMESMGDLLQLGRRALGLAKHGSGDDRSRDRNALAVLLDKRSGGTRAWRARWDDWGGDPAGRLRQDAKLLSDKLPARKVYEIESTLRRLPEGVERDDSEWAKVLALEVRRSLSRALGGEAAVEASEVGLHLDPSAGYKAVRREVASWIDRVLVAGAIAEAEPRKRGESKEAPA